MKKLSGKESRFVRNTSHVISSEIVHEAKDTSSTTAMENLEGIRMGTTVMKGKMYIHNSWSFPHFRSFIEYKAGEAGIPVIVIDPHNTSRECPNCHAITRKNRSKRSRFRCISCGLNGEADIIASINIRNRAAVNQPIVAGAIFDHSIHPVASQLATAVGS